MSCPRCGVFEGNPCAPCRTESRIAFILQSGKLRKEDEDKVLTALRSAAGALTDIAEQNTRLLPVPRLPIPPFVPGPVGPPPVGLPVPPPGAFSTEGSTEVEAAKVPEETQPEEGKPPKEKKEKKEKSKKHKKKEESEERGDKDERRSSGSKQQEFIEVKEELEEEEGAKQEEKKKENSNSPEAREATEKKREGEDLSAKVSAYAEAHPKEYGLSSKNKGGAESSTGSRDKDHKSWHHGGRRPPEPRGPPPGRREKDREKQRERKRSRSRRRGTKGSNHSQRGTNYWRGVRESQRYYW